MNNEEWTIWNMLVGGGMVCGCPTRPTDLLKETLAELSGEVLAGAANFKAAIDALDQTNSDTRSSLTVAEQSFGLADQGAIDSFDFSPWTAAGWIEAAESAVEQVAAGLLGLSEGSGSTEKAYELLGRPHAGADDTSTTSWREWSNGLDLSTAQPSCNADSDHRQADDDKAVIRPQPNRP